MYNDLDIEDYILNKNDNQNIKQMIASYPINSMKSNYWIFFVLYNEGGIYLDVDMKPLKEISQWSTFPFQDDLIISLKKKQQNKKKSDLFSFSAIISTKGHPLLKKILDKLLSIWEETGRKFTSIYNNDNIITEY